MATLTGMIAAPRLAHMQAQKPASFSLLKASSPLLRAVKLPINRRQQAADSLIVARAGGTLDRARKGAKKAAEGKSYGKNDGSGNSTGYLLLAIANAGVAGLFAFAPNFSNQALFGQNGANYASVLFPILSTGWLSAAVMNWTQEAASKAGVLDDDVHRRNDAALSFFAAANLFITAVMYLPTSPSTPPMPQASVALSTQAALQWWIAGRNYAKYSPEGANPLAIIKSYLNDLSKLGQIDGLNSGIYAVLTAAFIGAGFGYLFAPAQTLDLVFGTAAPKTPADLFVWQLIGAGLATIVGPIAYTQKEAALQNNFSRPDKRTLMAALASASIAHVVILTPLLGTENSGPGTLFLLGNWGLSTVASSLIAIKPSE